MNQGMCNSKLKLGVAKRPDVIAGLAVIVAGILRVYSLGTESLWLDEAKSWSYVTRMYTTRGILLELPKQDPHPPLYYLLLDGWTAVFGTSEAALRAPSVFFGVATVALTYLVGAKLFDRWAGVVTAGLVTVSSFHIYYSQEARMYSLLCFLSLLSLYFFIDLVERENWGQLTINLYILSTVALGYTHVYGLFVILAQGSYVGLRALLATDRWPGPNRLDVPSGSLTVKQWVGIQIFTGLMLLPWLFTFASRVLNVSAGGNTRVGWLSTPTPGLLFTTVKSYFGQGQGGIVSAGLSIALIVSFAALVTYRSEIGRIPVPDRATLMSVLWFAVPVLVPFVVSLTVTPILSPRYTISASIGLFLLVGKAVQTIRPVAPTPVRVLLVCVLIGGVAASLPAYYGADQKEQWKEVVNEIESSADEDALVVMSDGYTRTAYDYYSTRTELTIRGVDDTASSEKWQRVISDRENIYLVLSHTDRGDALTDRIERSGYKLVSEKRYVDVEVNHLVREDR